MVAAKVAEKLYTSSFASGVFHIEQLFDPLEFIESLGNNLRFEESASKTQVQLESLPKGVYFLQISNSSETAVQKIIEQ